MGAGFGIATRLAADTDTIWPHASSAAGMLAELAPVRMAVPVELRLPGGLERLRERVPGRDLYRCTVTLWGLIPLDRHQFGFDAITPGHGFVEESTTFYLKRWRHARSLTAVPGGTELKDEVWIESRLPGLDRLLLPIYRAVFRRRHIWLRKRFGVAEEPQPVAETTGQPHPS